jgi:hypothetical protein
VRQPRCLPRLFMPQQVQHGSVKGNKIGGHGFNTFHNSISTSDDIGRS